MRAGGLARVLHTCGGSCEGAALAHVGPLSRRDLLRDHRCFNGVACIRLLRPHYTYIALDPGLRARDQRRRKGLHNHLEKLTSAPPLRTPAVRKCCLGGAEISANLATDVERYYSNSPELDRPILGLSLRLRADAGDVSSTVSGFRNVASVRALGYH